MILAVVLEAIYQANWRMDGQAQFMSKYGHASSNSFGPFCCANRD